MTCDSQREGEVLDLEDDWADVRPAPDPEDVRWWALEIEDLRLGAEMTVPLDGIDQLARNLGVDREVLTAGDVVGDGPRTISAWVRTASSDSQSIMAHTGDNGYDLRLWEGHVIFQTNLQMLTTFRTFNDGNWHHVVIVGTSAIYVDGAPVEFRTDEPGPLGEGPTGSAGLDDLAVWDRILSSADVQALYNGGVPSDLAVGDLNEGLVSWYRLGDPPPTPFDEPLTTETIRGFDPSFHDCSKDLEDGAMCPICGRIYWTPPSRYELLMKD